MKNFLLYSLSCSAMLKLWLQFSELYSLFHPPDDRNPLESSHSARRVGTFGNALKAWAFPVEGEVSSNKRALFLHLTK